MAKRIAFMLVGLGIGGLVGLLVSFVAGGGNWAIAACGIAGAIVPVFLGPPGK